ncbi:uncharacterized protein PV09_03985 [Verruconis gallopava]|uniref:Uncharacterized protein n=1 Tax=Verruconis gallopava TaxID=253628 RepID=A0A0D2B095_9PEZI|nr:uncharacterized protein PV09_03985 [Verruconis gallopava]KIW04799.1 hypothetical protein PV09_03985 [Verruconis gallopava]
MPFREKAREIRKKFSRGSSSTSGTSSEASSTLGDDLIRHTTHTVYKPGERIPYKYRRPVEKAHKEKLEAFCFADAWNSRPKSFASQYSPMGSRLPSRRGSMEFHGARRSMHLRRGDTGELADGSDEDSAANVDSSTDGLYSSSETSGFLTPGDAIHQRPQSQHETPFTQEDLALALQRSRLEIPP